jgi:hypothetical protein
LGVAANCLGQNYDDPQIAQITQIMIV